MRFVPMKTKLFCAALCLLSALAYSQEGEKTDRETREVFIYSESGFEPGKKYLVTRHDGIEYRGEILSDDNREILMNTKTVGKIYIPKFEISTIHEIVEERSVGYTYQAEGPFTTRYSFTTNAHPIKKGENYGMLNIYGPEFHLAVSDRLNVGLMSTWIASPIVLAG